MKSNIIINLISKLWTGLISILIVPTYLHILGSEQWGLVGVYMAMLPVVFLLDGGLGASLNRSFARFSTQPDSAKDMRDTLRTAEWVFWSLSLLIALLIGLCSSVLATYFVHAAQLTHAQITLAIIMMGFSTAVLFPFGLYQGGFMGLQRQAHFNAILVMGQTLRVFGVLPIFHFFGHSIIVFFVWQIIVTGLQNLAATIILWNLIPTSGNPPRASMQILRTTRDFSVGVFSVNLLTAILTQIDRPVLSYLRPLAEVGAYAIASVAAGSLCNLFIPVYSAAFPRFSELVALKDDDKLREAFHVTAQAMAIFVVPFTVILVGLPNVLLKAWDPSMHLPDTLPLTMAFLAIGWGLYGLFSIPYALQLAHGWTKLAITFYAASVCIQLPLLFILGKSIGGVGIASVWAGVNVATILIVPNIMFNKLLKSSRAKWYLQDVMIPILACLVVFMGLKSHMPVLTTRLECIGYLAVVFILCSAATALSVGDVRHLGFQVLTRIFVPNSVNSQDSPPRIIEQEIPTAP